MYREEVLDLYKNPLNEGRIEDAQEAEGENPSCGDSNTFYIRIEGEKVEKIRHETEACAICTAANSIVADELEGEKLEKIESLDSDWILERLDINLSPIRVKCAVLGLKTVQRALKK